MGCGSFLIYFFRRLEERSPEPKPRWNPRPEQIRILEAIFNSGMVNPPRDEIRKIRAKLQEYGQVGDANVFYWFQNRKSRSKHKQRHLQAKSQQQQNNSSSSSSSDKSSPNSLTFSIGSSNVMDLLNSPTSSVNQQNYDEFLSNEQPFFFTVQPPPAPIAQTHDHSAMTQGFCFPDSTTFSQSSSALFPSEWMGISQAPNISKKVENEKMNLQSQLMSYTVTSTVSPPATTSTIPAISNIQGNSHTPSPSVLFYMTFSFFFGHKNIFFNRFCMCLVSRVGEDI